MLKQLFLAMSTAVFSLSVSAGEISLVKPSVASLSSKNSNVDLNKFLKLTAFQILDAQDVVRFQMDSHGRAMLPDGSKVKINSRGLVTGKNGKLIAKLNSDSILVDSKGATIVKISPNGSIDNESGRNLQWLEDGTFSEQPDLRIVPANTPSLQAASMIVFLYMNFAKIEVKEIAR